MSKDTNAPDDVDLFRKAVGTVQPLKHEPRHLARAEKPALIRSSAQATVNSTRPLSMTTIEQSRDYLEQLESLESLDPSIDRVFIRPGLQHRTMKQLRRGKISLGNTLDLHGATALQAKQKLSRFITASIASNSRAVIIVHGKGMRSTNNTPVLKTRVNYWLRENENVLGFCPAAPRHGGSGALYVLLNSKCNDSA